MATNYISITETSHELSVMNIHKNKTYLYLCQQQHPDSKHMKEKEDKLEKRLLLDPNSLVY